MDVAVSSAVRMTNKRSLAAVSTAGGFIAETANPLHVRKDTGQIAAVAEFILSSAEGLLAMTVALYCMYEAPALQPE